MFWVHFLFGVPLRPKKCEQGDPNLYNLSISYLNITFISEIKYFLQTFVTFQNYDINF